MGRAASLAVAIALVGCAKPRPVVFGEQMPASCNGVVDVEQCAGWLIDRILTMSQGAYIDDDIAAYVSGVGDRLVRAQGDRRRWTFLVTDDHAVQAYAGLSTTVFINRGALALLRDEAELAAVLGHEMAHVLGGHLHENYRDILQGSVGRSSESERHANRYARDDEIQADEVAVLLLAKAGYDTRGAERMLRALAATSPDDGEQDTEHHPRWIERIARVQMLAAAHLGGETGADRFRSRIAQLVIGADPRRASIVGNAAVFAHSNVAIDLPPHVTAEVDGADVTIQIDATSGFGVRSIDPRLARALASRLEETPDASLVIIERPRISLMIAIVGPDARLVAKRVKQSVRTPRPDELRAIRPTRIDLAAPRLLWHP